MLFKIYRYWYTDLLFEVKFYFVSKHLPDEQGIYFADSEGQRAAFMSKCPQCYSELAVFADELNAVRVEDLSGKLKKTCEYGI